ncbi:MULTISPECIES: type VI secretion system-associated protein TagF [Falsihalocynthiibacter]|uniref:type VI secretion system-associated protein TagF n=1 Tax=Falsihalocynthiibacter TaxID=2854182 RepID=UPI0030013D3A
MAGFGAFGKIPSLGDFFRINVSSDFVRPWDQWLQMGLSNVRNSLGEEWQACYMSAPIWRFTLSAGLAGQNAAMGVLMPSVDRVGRAFPLTLVTPIALLTEVSDAHLSATATFEELELVALDALEDSMTTEALSTRLSAIPLVGEGPQASPKSRSISPTSVWSARLDEDTRTIRCSGLPDECEMEGLFNLEAAIWNTNDQRIGAQT